jgi:glucosamine kinase
VFLVYFVVTNSCKIGVDGGGTKTELILIDAGGTILHRQLAPGCNPSHIGPEKARTILRDALASLRAAAGTPPVGQMMLFMAGSPIFWREFATSLTDCGQVATAPDSLPVLELATGGAPGLVLHAGTGSFVSARAPDGSIHYSGGLGWKFGDAGSGFDLGRRAIAQAMLELQSGAPSTLAEALCRHVSLEEYAVISRYFYNDPAAHEKIAAFAPQVIELAVQDCGPAQQVVADSIGELARLAHQVIHRFFPSATDALPCGISGRILNSGPAAHALRSLALNLRWPVELRFIAESPIEGVRRLLLAAR